MTFVALWSPALPTDAVPPAPRPAGTATDSPPLDALGGALLALVPHVVVESRTDGALLWADARGLPGRRIAREVLRAARRAGLAGAHVGVARVAVAAEVAARHGAVDTRAPVTVIAAGHERRFLAGHPFDALPISFDARRLLAAVADLGMERCGDLAQLTQEAVEVRLGADGVALWRLARADDQRPVFRHSPRPLPAASLEWEEYALRDTERLVFVANRLVGRVCAELRSRGEAARAMTLTLPLVGEGSVERAVRAARATANPATWLRLVRAALERGTLPDAARGLAIRVDGVHETETPQGDLFDRGFQTGASAEAAVARLVEDGIGAPGRLEVCGHALPERRARWRTIDFRELAGVADGASPTGSGELAESLALRLLPAARPLSVVTYQRRGCEVPVHYRECLAGRVRAPHGMPLVQVLDAAGPDRVAVGGETGTMVVREYWQCLTDEGRLVLIFHGVAPDGWYLHGWWD